MADKLLIDQVGDSVRAARMRNGRLDDLIVEPAVGMLTGGVYVGRVRRVLDGLNGAFVDIGEGKDSFLRAHGARFAGVLEDDEPPEEPDPNDDEPLRIGDFVTEGEALIVQVQRPPYEDKGAAVTTEITIPGRYVVLKANSSGLNISRRLDDEERAEEFRKALEPLLADRRGLIVRTAAARTPIGAVVQEAESLIEAWTAAFDKRGKDAPAPIWPAPDAAFRILRDVEPLPSDGIEIDGVDGVKALKDRIADWPDLAGQAVFHPTASGIFKAAGADDEIADALETEVGLDGGGRLWIETTRALTAIDVDTGGATGGQAILETNLAAASEIARQLRLRNIGGLVVVDFVHMRRRDHQAEVVDLLREEVQGDRARVQVASVSSFGLVEVLRDRLSPSLAELSAALKAE